MGGWGGGGADMKRLTLACYSLRGLRSGKRLGSLHPDAKDSRPSSHREVKDDLYMISGEGGNVAVYVTSEASSRGRYVRPQPCRYSGANQSVTDKPLKYVVNTHQHDDHAGGDLKMLPIAEVIAHKNARANLVDIKQPYYEDTPGTPIGLPRLTFSDEFSIYLGGKEVRAKYFGRGHTSGDAVVYFPSLRVIHSGDLFLGQRGGRGPNIYVDYAQGGSFIEWTKTLDGMLTLDFDVVIPGHGPVSTKADVVKFRADVERMRNRITGLVRDGAPKADVLKVLETDYGWRSTGCPLTPPTPGCLQFQQSDALIAELKN